MNQIDISAKIILDNLEPVLALGFFGFVLSMLLTPIYTNLAFKYMWWKKPRQDTVSGEKAKVFSKLHAKKHERHIPTMAGMISVVALSVVTIIFNLDRGQTWLPLAAAIGAGLVGLLDDVVNLKTTKGTAGLDFKVKLLLTTLIAVGLSYWFTVKLGYTAIHIPFGGELGLGVGLAFIFYVFIIIATANAVNITDGLDGLAAGLLVSGFGALALIAVLQGNFGIAGFCLSMVGVLLSFLWFNIYPARFFMGDVGSFAFGTTLAVVAIMLDVTLLIPLIGFLFVVEVLSVSIQLLSKKFRGKKIFLSAPIHHHLEAIGWPETKITMRAWVLSQVFAFFGVLIAILGGHINL